MDRIYEDVKNMLCKELEEIGRKGELTSNNLEVMYKSVDIVKDLYVIDARQHEGYSYDYSNEYSETYRPRYMYDGHPQNSYDNRGRGSHADRDSMGRYSSDGYSRTSADDLRGLMSRTQNEQDREILRKALENMR